MSFIWRFLLHAPSVLVWEIWAQIFISFKVHAFYINSSVHFFWFFETDHRGYAATSFGPVRRVKTPYGWGVRTCPSFACEADDAIFIIRGMIAVTASEKQEWCGYTFVFDKDDERRPPHSVGDNVAHAPMMVNTHCEEKNECHNLSLLTEEDIVIFEATRPIKGGEMLVVDYGSDYNKELLEERKAAIQRRRDDLSARRNITHSFKCPKCGQSCHMRFRLRHYNTCIAKAWKRCSVMQNLDTSFSQ